MTGFALEPPSPGDSSPPPPDRHSKDILTPLSLDTRPSSSPFPSPSSSFVPPPMPGAHEFANRPPIGRIIRNKKASSLPNMHEDLVNRKNHAPDVELPKLLNGSVPNLDIDVRHTSLGVTVTPVTPTPASIIMSSTSSTSGALPVTSTASECMGGHDTPTQTQITLPPPPASPTHVFGANVSTLVRTPSGSGTASKHTSLSSSRPAPASPAPSRRQSGAPSLRSRHRSGLSTVSVSSSKVGTVKAPPFVVSPVSRGEIKIRDFAFPPVDARHTGRGPDTPKVIKRLLKRHGPAAGSGSRRASGVSESSLESEEGGSRRNSGFNGWGTFRWASKLGNAWGFGGGNGTNRASTSGGYTPSQLDFERNFDDGTEHESTDAPAVDMDDGDYLSDDYDDDGEDEAENEELLPGLYRALYDFDPEGTAEMGLKEGQIIRVVGRGGGVGWAIAVRADAEDKESSEANWALVPESYLKAVRLDDIKPDRDGGPSLDDSKESGEQVG